MLYMKSLCGILTPSSLRNPCTDGKLQYYSANSEDRCLAWCSYDGLFHSAVVREKRGPMDIKKKCVQKLHKNDANCHIRELALSHGSYSWDYFFISWWEDSIPLSTQCFSIFSCTHKNFPPPTGEFGPLSILPPLPLPCQGHSLALRNTTVGLSPATRRHGFFWVVV